MTTNHFPGLEAFRAFLDGHPTEIEHLHPNDQEKARIAFSVGRSAVADFGFAEELFPIQVLRDAASDAWNKDGNLRRDDWSELPYRTKMYQSDDWRTPEFLAIPSSSRAAWRLLIISHDQTLDKFGKVRRWLDQYVYIGEPIIGDRNDLITYVGELKQAMYFVEVTLPNLTGRGERPEHRHLNNGSEAEALDF